LLEIPRPAAEYIIPKDYVKPDISVGNYYLKWDDSSCGIARKEVAELKGLINDLLPHISSTIYEAAKEIHTAIEENTKGPQTRRIESFSPELLLSRRREGVTYTVRMKRDGTTLLHRSEAVVVIDNGTRKVLLEICWVIGEFLFDRQSRYT